MITMCKLQDGHVLHLFEPSSSGNGPMRSGRCPVCRESLYTYTGRFATIRELDKNGNVVTNSEHVRPYGHLHCMAPLFAEMSTRLTLPETPDELTWTVGRQKDLLDFLKSNQGSVIECSRDDSLPQSSRYHFRTVTQ